MRITLGHESCQEIVTRYLLKWNGVGLWVSSLCNVPDEAQLFFKFAQMARTLSAFAVGDDNERYELKKGFFGKEKLVIIPDA